jgi:hypothetical protein
VREVVNLNTAVSGQQGTCATALSTWSPEWCRSCGSWVSEHSVHSHVNPGHPIRKEGRRLSQDHPKLIRVYPKCIEGQH